MELSLGRAMVNRIDLETCTVGRDLRILEQPPGRKPVPELRSDLSKVTQLLAIELSQELR